MLTSFQMVQRDNKAKGVGGWENIKKNYQWVLRSSIIEMFSKIFDF